MTRFLGAWLGLLAACAWLDGSMSAQEAAPPARGVRGVAISADGTLLAAGAGGPKQKGTVTVWDLATRQPRWTHRQQQGIPAVAFSPGGRHLAIGGYDKTARLLDVATGKESARLEHPDEVRAVAFSPDGKLLATACWDGVVRLWDVAARTEKVRCTAPKEQHYGVQFSPDGRSLVSLGHRDGPKVWDSATGTEKLHLKISHESSFVPAAAFSSDGRWLLSGGWDGRVCLWELGTGQMRASFSGSGGVDALAYSAEAGMMAVNAALFDLTLREPTAAEHQRILALLTNLDDDSYDAREATCEELLRIGFLAEPELRRASKESTSAEVRVRSRHVRQMMLSKPRLRLRGHTDPIQSVAFTPDGKLLVSGALDGTVRLWDSRTGKETAKLAVD